LPYRAAPMRDHEGGDMHIPKPSDQDKDRFRALIPEAPGVEVKAMFGNLGAFVNGNMFAGLFGSSIGVELVEPSSREELAAIPGTGPYGPVTFLVVPGWGLLAAGTGMTYCPCH
jgi:hypothetical protein